MKKILLFLPILGLLSACQPPLTREQQLTIYRSRCSDYGYPPGTKEFADCMKEQEARGEELAIQARRVRAEEERNQIAQEQVEVGEDIGRTYRKNSGVSRKKKRKWYD